MTPPTIRPLTPDDYDQWWQLYQGYADFYQVALIPGGVQTTWSWLIDAERVRTGLVAEQSGQLVDLAHFRGMPSPLCGQMIRFLDGLFVVPENWSGGVAALLIKAVQAAAKAEGWGVVRWITRENNYRAHDLYDKLAEKTDWALHEMAAK